ncbi:MAG: hypothetical protein ACJ79R_01120 [Anaeromyxobacteraceae bacterium]
MRKDPAVVILNAAKRRPDAHHGKRFGADEARALEGVLAGSGAAEVTLDVSQVALDDAAIGHLARALHRVGARVRVRGLTLHQRRMLRYLGIDGPAPGGPRQ